MADTGAPWNIPYVEPADLVRDYPAADEAQALAIAAGLTDASIIRQVVSTTKTDTFSTTSATFGDITGLTVSITPSSASNKILLIADVKISGSSASSGHLRFSGGNSSDYVGDATGSRVSSAYSTGLETINWGFLVGMLSPTLVYLDAPGTATAVTYAVQVRRGSGTVQINRTGQDSNNEDYGRTASTIFAIEVAA